MLMAAVPRHELSLARPPENKILNAVIEIVRIKENSSACRNESLRAAVRWYAPAAGGLRRSFVQMARAGEPHGTCAARQRSSCVSARRCQTTWAAARYRWALP